MAPRLAFSIAAYLAIVALASAAHADADDFCAKVRNDDRLRPYDAAMRPDFVRAFKKLFPNSIGGQSDAMFKAEAVFRCMEGKLVACFTGANLPCGKINRAPGNSGADAFCRVNPQARDVPLVASGHASEFTFRCHDGRAEVSGTAWTADSRGFAKETWTLLDLD